MDDDTKYYTIQLKGTAYRFQPLDPDDIARFMTAMHLSLKGTRVVSELSKILKASAGDDQWDAITDRYLKGELSLNEFTVGVFERLIKRQDKDGLLAPSDAE